MKIKINGKEVEASEITLQDAIESVFGKQFEDIPDIHDSPFEYLALKGLNLTITKCDTKEKVNDLSKKLKERLVWINKHKTGYKYNEVVDFLKGNAEEITNGIEALSNAVDAYKLVLGYINSVIETTKKK
jgi:hypothetical protein